MSNEAIIFYDDSIEMLNLKSIMRWVLPVGLLPYVSRSNLQASWNLLRYGKIIAENIDVKNSTAGHKRVFILCNGPSVNQQNIRPLKHEKVISVSSGYLHKGYDEIAPHYHCVPQITYGLITEDDVILWFTEMHAKLGEAELFLSLSEYSLVQRNGLFVGRKVYYLCFGPNMILSNNQIIDLTDKVPNVSSVPIMALMVAMYIGYKEIYLIGTDHDSFQTNKYTYAFETTVLRGLDLGVKVNGEISNLYEELKALLALWEQYRAMKIVAQSNDIKIYNATYGGALDVFERVRLDHVVIK